MDRMLLRIEGMTCGHCAGAVAGALRRLPGVEVDRVTGSGAMVRRDPERATEDDLRVAVEGAGYRLISVVSEGGN
jgi:copper chaperone